MKGLTCMAMSRGWHNLLHAHYLVALAMAARALTAAGGDVNAVSFDVYENADNVYLRQKSPGVSDLGVADGVMACQTSCTSRLGTDPTTGCTSFTFYHKDYNDARLAGHCFGDTTGTWAPFYSTYVNPMGPDPSCFWGNVFLGF